MSEFDIKFDDVEGVAEADRVRAAQTFDLATAELREERETLDPILLENLSMADSGKLITELARVAEQDPSLLKEYIRHSSRFSYLARAEKLDRLFDWGNEVTVEADSADADQYGHIRREEAGYRLNMEFVEKSEIDPKYVLFFRATQPADQPKPEWYWTSDYAETVHGLRAELGDQSSTAVILVSTLEEINRNGGLINDINEDEGVSVQQVGSKSYDQSEALCMVTRQGPKPRWYE